MAPTNEKGLEKAIVRAVREQHPETWVMKVHGGQYQSAGIPDLLLCVQGRFVALEVKFQHPGESEHAARARATKRQSIEVDRINRAGGTAAVVLSIEESLAHVAAALAT